MPPQPEPARESAPAESRKRLAARLVGLGAIPIAVFCAAYLLASRVLPVQEPRSQAWILWIALGASLASLFLLATFAARAVAAEIEAVRIAARDAAAGTPLPAIPALTPPLEELKEEVVSLAQQLHGQQARLQERLDAARQQLFFLGHHDALTGLPNRKAVEERLEAVVASAKANGATHAFLYIDVDLFHRVNDAFGHAAGNELLRGITPVLKAGLREGELLARIGGDEFAVIIENVAPDFAMAAATHLRDAVQAWRFDWSGGSFQVGVSIGVVAITPLTPSLSSVLSEADNACFTAKEQGRNRVVAFHAPEAAHTLRHTSRGWLRRINGAIAEGTFTLLYQPILPLAGAAALERPRVEALLRMSETGGELILPMSFIPVAERYDLMRTIDRWVVERAFADFRRLMRARDDPAPAEFSVNLSGHTLSSPEFGEFMQEKLAQYGVPPQCLFLEITETAAIANMERARAVIEQLRAAGVRFLLDDFGSGLSSFNYLKHFPVDGIKVDGLFVRGVARHALDHALVSAIHRIGTDLGLLTIAEYVENEEIAQALAQIGIPMGQGFHLGPPRPWESLFGA